MLKNDFKWYCINCGAQIDFTCFTDAECEHTPPVEVEIKCKLCNVPYNVLAVNNRVYKVEATIYNPIKLEADHDCIH